VEKARISHHRPQPVKNQDLWQKLEQAAGQHEVEWKWVRGHAGNRMNELCDRLAKEALENGLNTNSEAAGEFYRAVNRILNLTTNGFVVRCFDHHP
jgi:ribonuclease HI